MYGACEAVIAVGVRGRAAGRRSHHHQVPARDADAPGRSRRSSRRRSTRASRPCASITSTSTSCTATSARTTPSTRTATTSAPASRRRGASTSNEVVPAFEDLKRRGRIGAWGITGVGVPATILEALRARREAERRAGDHATCSTRPAASGRYAEPPRPRAIIAEANAHGVGVMGIRAVQAGALTAEFDRVVKASHPDAVDYRAGRAVPRAVRRAREWIPRCSRTVTRSTWRVSTPSCSGSRTAPSSRSVSRPRRSGRLPAGPARTDRRVGSGRAPVRFGRRRAPRRSAGDTRFVRGSPAAADDRRGRRTDASCRGHPTPGRRNRRAGAVLHSRGPGRSLSALPSAPRARPRAPQ